MKSCTVTRATSCLIVAAALVCSLPSSMATLTFVHKSHPLLSKLLSFKHPYVSGYTGMKWFGNKGVSVEPLVTGSTGGITGRRMLTLGPLLMADAGAVNAANAAVQPKFAALSGAALAMGMPALADVVNKMGASTMAASGMAIGTLTNPAWNGPLLGRRLLTGPLGGFLKAKLEKQAPATPSPPQVIIVPAPQPAPQTAAPATAAPAVAAPAVQPMYIPAPAPAAQPTSVNVNLNVNQYQQQPTVIPVPAPAPAPQSKLAALIEKFKG